MRSKIKDWMFLFRFIILRIQKNAILIVFVGWLLLLATCVYELRLLLV